MLFCLAANNVSLTGYYEGVNPATPETVRAIPEDIEVSARDPACGTIEPFGLLARLLEYAIPLLTHFSTNIRLQATITPSQIHTFKR